MEQLELREEVGEGIFFQYVNSFTSVLAGFIFYIYIIHFYSSELVGTVALLLAITSLLGFVFSLGLGSGLQHFISYHLGRMEYSFIKGITTKFSAIGLGLAILSMLFLYFSAPIFASLFFHSAKYIPLVKFLGIDLFFILMSMFLSGIVFGFQNFKSQAIWSLVGIVVTYLLPVILLHFSNNVVLIILGWASGFALSSVAYSILIFKKMRKLPPKTEKISISPVLKYSLPLFLASVVGYGASYVDRFIVSYFTNLSLLGVYNFALLISTATSFLISPFGNILLPKLSEMYGAGRRDEMKEYISKGIELISTIYVPVSMLIAALSSYILLFLSNGEYLSASVPMIIILIFSSLFIAGNILTVAIQSIRKTRIFLVITSIALLSNFVISVILIPKYQMIGASMGYSSLSVVSFAILYYYARKFEILKFERTKIAKIYLSAFLMFLVINTLQRMLPYSPLKLLLFIIVGFAIYLGMVKVLKTFNKSDLEFIMSLIPWWLQKIKGVISVLLL